MYVHTFIPHGYTDYCTRFRSRMLKRRDQAAAGRQQDAEYINASPEPSDYTTNSYLYYLVPFS